MSQEPSATSDPRPIPPAWAVERLRGSLRERLFGAAFERPRLGRFELLGEAGRGAMGVVYRARDPALGRVVALKVVHPSAVHDDARARLVEEARVAAAVAHPNIVEIYDVGSIDDDVFIAMEYVDGASLWEWLKHTPRSRAQILDVFMQASRGLAAAHAAGIVHRDFKPQNVLIDRSGRVRVADFGLARGTASSDRTQVAEASGSDPTSASYAAVGTPIYMSPEQHLGQRATTASDQFAFCVALHQALHGELPFVGETLPRLRESVIAGHRRRTARRDRLDRVLARGLAREPARRYRSMHDLMRALERSAPSRVLWATGAVALLVIGVAAMQPRSDPPSRCGAFESRRAEVWNDERARSLSDRMGADATDTGVLRDVLDAYASKLDEARATACASAVASSPDLACLESRLAELDALLRHLGTAEPSTPSAATGAALALARPELCTTIESTPAPSFFDASDPTALAAATDRLADTKALYNLGRYDQALTAGDEAVALAEATGGHRMIAAALHARGLVLDARNDAAGAESDLASAYSHALEEGEFRIAAASAGTLASLVAEETYRLGPAKEWIRHGESLIERGGLQGTDIHVRLLENDARVLLEAGDPQRAEQTLTRAIAMHEAGGGDDRSLSLLLYRLGVALSNAGRFEESLAVMRRGIAAREAVYGSDHPEIAPFLDQVGLALSMLGRFEDAEQEQRRTVALLRAHYGDADDRVLDATHTLALTVSSRGDYAAARDLHRDALERRLSNPPVHDRDVALSLTALGSVYASLGDFEEAASVGRQALELRENLYGADHSHVGNSLGLLAFVLMQAGRYAEALPLCERALVIYEASFGPQSPFTGLAHLDLAGALRGTGRFEEARREAEATVAIWTSTIGPDHADMVAAYTELGAIALDIGERDVAGTHFERALAIDRASTGETHRTATLVANLAGAKDGAEARELFEEAVRVSELTQGDDHPAMATALVGLGLLASKDGRRREAKAFLERAIALFEAAAYVGPDRGEALFALARLEGRRSADARALAERAVQSFTAAGMEERAAAVRAWLG